VTDNNVTDLNAYRVSQVIMDYWMDSYSDNGAIYDRAKRHLEAVKANCPEDVWEQALQMATIRWAEQ